MTTENGSGWKAEGNGWYQGPKMDDTTTPEFTEHAELSRARWNLHEFLKTKMAQLLRKSNPQDKQNH